jgi:sterol desaturase/sphingolipid hydroxylase (fatty acid hydroxylase superfamily)
MRVLLTRRGRVPQPVGLALALICALRSPLLVGALLLYASCFMLLERLLPARRPTRTSAVTDVIHALVSTTLVALALAVVAATLTATPLEGLLRPAIAWLPGPLGLAIAVIAAEVAHYWMHRAQHSWAPLWRFHALHHAAEELDWLTTARVHPVDGLLAQLSALVPLILLGIAPPLLVGYAVVAAVQNVLAHANVDIGFGPLRWVLLNPRFHSWHHSRDARGYDRNFAGQLPVIDRIFGTYRAGAPPEGMGFGITEAAPETWAGQVLEPFRRRRPGTTTQDLAA